jgi:dynein heavy chain
VLSFSSYKDFGEICLDKAYTEQLLEQLEDAQEILANMLTSKHVTPLRNEVASWSEKLKTICDVLELWVDVQDLWINLESVFTLSTTIKEMPSEAKRFARVDKSWIRSQKQSYDIKSVIQCCLGSSVQENTKRALLKDIQKELEICFKSLNVYLDKKRRSFPRYYFLSNPALLTLLNYYSNTANLNDVKCYFSSLFATLYDLKLDEIKDKLEERGSSVSSFSEKPVKSLTQNQAAQMSFSETPSFFRLNTSKEKVSVNQSSWEISEVYSRDGEILVLCKKVNLEKGAETWIPKLRETIADSLKRYTSNSLYDVLNNVNMEELPLKYPAQICLLCLNYLWTKEIESSLVELKNERKAVTIGSKKFNQITGKLLALLSKSKWTSVDKPILNFHKLRIEAMITVSCVVAFFFARQYGKFILYFIK